jgi:AcrR family transcriptional regulator
MTEATPAQARGEKARPRLTRAEAKARTRGEVLRAAEAVFRREGYHGASLERIAAEAGFTTGAVYSTFDSKADVMLALLEGRAERRRGVWVELLETEPTAERFVAEIARRNAAEVAAERDWWAVVIEFLIVIGRDEELRARYSKLWEASRTALVESMRAWLRRTGDRPAMPIERVATAVTALTRGLVLEGLVAPSEASEEVFVDAQLALMRGSLAGHPGGGAG